MSFFAAGLLAVAAVLVGVARRTADRPPLWRSKLAFAGAVACLVAVALVAALDPPSLFDTPLLLVAALCLFEGSFALVDLRACAGRGAPRWLA